MKDDEFCQARYKPDQWKPEIRHRELKMVKTGIWFFGLFNTYKLQYTEWEEEK
jgi:hypothetical protein